MIIARVALVSFLVATPALAGKRAAAPPPLADVCTHIVALGVAAHGVSPSAAQTEAMQTACLAELELHDGPELAEPLRCAVQETTWRLLVDCGPAIDKAVDASSPLRRELAAACAQMVELLAGLGPLTDDERRSKLATCRVDMSLQAGGRNPPEAVALARCVAAAPTLVVASACFEESR